MEDFIKNALNGNNNKASHNTSIVEALYKKPVRDAYGDNPTFPQIDDNYLHQMDVLYVPNDGGYKYILVVVDQGSRHVGAEGMKDRSVNDIIRALKAIYKRKKYLLKPHVVVTDSGSEFSSLFTEGLDNMGIHLHKNVKIGRSRSVSLAERKNQTIGSLIHKILTQVQLTTGQPSSKWMSYLPIIIKEINLKVDEQNSKIPKTNFADDAPFTYNKKRAIDMLEVGDKVRVQLDKPIDTIGNKLNGKFRSSDIRWNPEIRTVKYFYMKPEEPIMYFLNGNEGSLHIESVGYTRNQLQKVSNNEQVETPLFENEAERGEVQKIKERKKVGRSFQYLVKFKNDRKSYWIARNSLVEDLGVSYMNKIDKALDK